MSNKLAKSEDEKKLVFKRDESNLKNAPTILALVLPICMIAMIGLVVFGLISAFSGDYIRTIVCAVVFLVLLMFGRYCDTLNWIRNLEYSFENGRFDCFYNLDSSMLPTSNSKVYVYINEIDSYKVTKNNIVVYGSISKVAPMQKTKTTKKYKFVNIPEYTDSICKLLDVMIEG